MSEVSATVSTDQRDPEPLPAMGFLDHLEELRRRIVYSIAAVAVGFFACWWKVEKIYDVMQRPIMDALRNNGLAENVDYLKTTEPYIFNFKMSALVGTIL